MSPWPSGTVFWFRRVTPIGGVFGCMSQRDWSFTAALKEEIEERLAFGDILEVRVFQNLEEMMAHDFSLIDAASKALRPTETCPCCGSKIKKEIGVTYYSDGAESRSDKIEHHYRKVRTRRSDGSYNG